MQWYRVFGPLTVELAGPDSGIAEPGPHRRQRGTSWELKFRNLAVSGQRVDVSPLFRRCPLSKEDIVHSARTFAFDLLSSG